MRASILKEEITNKNYDQKLIEIYVDPSLLSYQRDRYVKALSNYIELYGDDDVAVFSVAGRSEMGGNHTDHQHGRVLAAAINLDIIAIAAKKKIIKIVSDDYDLKHITLDDLEKHEEEVGTSEALVRGVCRRLGSLGYKIGGFSAYMTSDVLVGSGLSSSAAFEDMIGVIISGLYNDMMIDMVTIAKVGQYAENEYFGKPCGLMDQCACAVGGLIAIDFKDPENPQVKKVDIDFSDFGYSLCIIDAKGSHASLTDEYAAIPAEMKEVARFFGEEYLRDVAYDDFIANLPLLRKTLENDRAVLRAYHFFKENVRVSLLVKALTERNFADFKKYVKESGDSSYRILQNVYAASDPAHQSLAIAIISSEDILKEHGFCRVHGGGFAGTIQAFVENDYCSVYKEKIDRIFGQGSCHILKIRKYGGMRVS